MSIVKQAAVILPYQNLRVLLQLRDEKTGILYPGHWGFFGGTVESGESPFEAAQRELYEEIAYIPAELAFLGRERLETPDELTLSAFYCPLGVRLSDLKLQEGFDVGLFSFAEIRSARLFSAKAQKMYPVIDQPCIRRLVAQLMERIA